MGWSYTHRGKYDGTLRDYFQRGWTGHTILDSGTVNRREFYAAVRNDSTGEVFGFVAMLDFRPNDDYNFGYKETSENGGPVQCNCPKRILDLLTPTTHEYALRWRERCREKIAARAARVRVKKGDTIRFDAPIRFTDGVLRDTFVVRNPRSSLFCGPGPSGLYRIPGWRQRGYELVGAAA